MELKYLYNYYNWLLNKKPWWVNVRCEILMNKFVNNWINKYIEKIINELWILIDELMNNWMNVNAWVSFWILN